MKATGIVRRIDDLGRVVMPKEIRRTMRIREGDPLEIYTNNDGEVIFKKYSPIGELSAFSVQYAEALHKIGGLPAVICDRDHVVAVAGLPKKEMVERRLSVENGCPFRRGSGNQAGRRNRTAGVYCLPDLICRRRGGSGYVYHFGSKKTG